MSASTVRAECGKVAGKKGIFPSLHSGDGESGEGRAGMGAERTARRGRLAPRPRGDMNFCAGVRRLV